METSWSVSRLTLTYSGLLTVLSVEEIGNDPRMSGSHYGEKKALFFQHAKEKLEKPEQIYLCPTSQSLSENRFSMPSKIF